MKRSLILVFLLFALPVAAWAQVAPKAASNGAVTDLGALVAGYASFATAVSPKGDVVVGYANTNYFNATPRAFRWTAAGGMQDLDPDPNDQAQASAYGISADGNVIAGTLGNGDCRFYCAFLWTSAGFQTLPVPGGWLYMTATGVSKDGSVVVGTASSNYAAVGWVWTEATGYVDICFPNCQGAQALAVSQDGKVVVGYSQDSNGNVRAFRWTQNTIHDLGFLPGGWSSGATGASANGSVVVGYGTTSTNCPNGQNTCIAPFRWTKAGLVQLPFLMKDGWPGATITTGVSADGKTVVGYAHWNCCDWQAWRWTAATGTQSVNDWLQAVGVDTSNASFYSAYAATANGYGVVGQLTNGDAYLALATSNKTGTPTFSPKPGKYQGSVTVTLNHTSPNASIYYTTDGSTPTKNSTPYTAPILVTVTTTIKAIAIVPSYPQSAVATGKYTIK